jgi:seryl-tRNA synthetase
LKNKSRAELQQIVAAKNNERNQVQKQIGEISIKREAYIAAERARAAGNTNTATLETQVEKIIKEQAKRFNMIIQ